MLQSSNLLSLSLVQIRLESIQKSPVSLKSTVAILMSFTCNDIYKCINQKYYNQVLWAISSAYQQYNKKWYYILKFVNHQLWSPQKNFHNVNDQVDGDCKFCCYICVSIYIYIYTHTLCQQLIVRVLGVFKTNWG